MRWRLEGDVYSNGIGLTLDDEVLRESAVFGERGGMSGGGISWHRFRRMNEGMRGNFRVVVAIAGSGMADLKDKYIT